MQIDIVLFPGFNELDVVGPYEILKRAGDDGLHVRLGTLDGRKEVLGEQGLTFRVQTQLDLERRSDMLIVPGGGWVSGARAGLRQELRRGALSTLIARWHAEGTIMASVCTGAMALATAGILKNRRATTHHNAMQDLRAARAKVVKERVVDDGNIITAGGITCGLDLGFWIVERFCGRGAVRKIAEEMEFERDYPKPISKKIVPPTPVVP